ncbi:MAG: InlB B-repeat-containing protein [Clostridiales bacterium]|nr:InlB B-repeat-containing protein [Clostridiales bacterium]
MKITRRILAVVLACLMAFGGFSVAVNAEGLRVGNDTLGTTTYGLKFYKYVDGKPSTTELEDGATLSKGDIIDVAVLFGTDFYTHAVSVQVVFDKRVYNTYDLVSGKLAATTAKNTKIWDSYVRTPDLDNIEAAQAESIDGTKYDFFDTLSSNDSAAYTGSTNNNAAGMYPAVWKTGSSLKPEYANMTNVLMAFQSAAETKRSDNKLINVPYVEYARFALIVVTDEVASDISTTISIPLDCCKTASSQSTSKVFAKKTANNDGYSASQQNTQDWGSCKDVTNAIKTFRIGTAAPESPISFKDADGEAITPAITNTAGETVDPTTLKTGDKILLPMTDGSTTHGNLTFFGWSDGTTTYAPGAVYTIPESKVELTGVYKAVATFYDKDGNELESLRNTVYSGEEIILPDAPQVNNFTFTGWDVGGSKYLNGVGYIVFENTQFYARYSENAKYSVTFNDKDGNELTDLKISNVYTGNTVKLPAAPAVEHFNFLYWQAGENTYAPDDDFEVTADTTFNAVYQEFNKFTVTFKDKDGNVLTDLTQTDIYDGDSITLPAAPTYSTFDFNDWFDGTKAYQPTDSYTVTGDTIFTARYTEKGKVKVTFIGFNGVELTNMSEEVTVGTQVSPPILTENIPHFRFLYWTYDEGSFIYGGMNIEITHATTFTAVYEEDEYCTVTYLDKDGNEITSLTDDHAYVGDYEIAALPTAPDHFTYNGWKTNGTVYSAGDTFNLTGDTTFTLDFTEDAKYNVTFRGLVRNGASELVEEELTAYSQSNVYTGTEITLPTADEFEHYTFGGWNDGTNTYNNGDPYNVTGNVTITATYTEDDKFTIDFLKKDGVTHVDGYPAELYVGTQIIVPTAETIEHWTFDGWKFGETTLQNGDNYTVSESATFTASYTEDPKFNVTFMGYSVDDSGAVIKDGSGTPVTKELTDLKMENIYKGTTFVVPAGPDIAHWTFVNWKVGTRNVSKGSNFTLNEDSVFVASYREDPKYDVTFNGKDGTELTDISLKQIYRGTQILVPAAPVIEHFNFNYWTSASKKYYPDDSYTVNGKAIFNANYTEDPKFSVTFKDKDGAAIADLALSDVYLNTEITLPDAPVVEKFRFTGWTFDGNTYDAQYKYTLTSNATFTATYEPTTANYTINVYRMDTAGNYGDPEVTTLEGNIGETVSVNGNDYIAEGFEIGANSNLSEVLPKTGTTLNVYVDRVKVTYKYYALTDETTYTEYSSAEYYYGAEVVIPNKPKNITMVYMFTGWAVGSADGEAFTATTAGATDLDIYATYTDIVVIAISLNTYPTKVNYTYKEEFDKTGMTLLVEYSDKTTEIIEDTSLMNVTGFDSTPKKPGNQTLTVEYEGVTKDFTVTVKLKWWQWLIKIFLFGWIWY